MTVASEIRAIGDADFALRGAVSTLGSDVTLPKGTKWAVIFGTASATVAVTAQDQVGVALHDGTSEVLIVTVPGLKGASGQLSNNGAPLAILDATDAALTVQAQAAATNTTATISGVFILEQCY